MEKPEMNSGGIVGDKKLKFKTDTLRVSQDGGEYAVDILANLSYDFTYPGMEEKEVLNRGGGR